MAYIGLAYPTIAKLGEDGVTYTDGFRLGEAVSTNLNIEYNEVKQYGDNIQTEHVKEFKSGAITLGITHLPIKAYETMFGHTVDTTTEPDVTTITDKTDDQPNYVGVGLIKEEMVNNVRSYVATWFYKALFTESGESAETKGENIVFQTPTVEGVIMAIKSKKWRERKIFKTEEAALSFIDGLAGIVTP